MTLAPVCTESTQPLQHRAPDEVLPTRKAKIFVVDDHPIFRHGLAQLLSMEPDFEVSGQAASAAQTLASLRNTSADLAILDISLEGANGIELIKHLRVEHPHLIVLVASMHDESLYALRALRAGASGYLTKKERPATILAAVRSVLAGDIYVSPDFGKQLICQVVRGPGEAGASPIERLTDRELEILELVGRGRNSRLIADELHLSVKTVESHRLHIKEKLGLGSASELIRFAADWMMQRSS